MPRFVKWQAAAAAVLAAACAAAYPLPEEIAADKALIDELTKPSIQACAKGDLHPETVGDKMMELFPSADTEASKYILLRQALEYYCRARNWSKAVAASEKLEKAITGYPALESKEVFLRFGGKGIFTGSGPVAEWYAKTAVKSEISATIGKLRASKTDKNLWIHLADLYARSGEWRKSLKILAKYGDHYAAWELDPAKYPQYDAASAADHWWEYGKAHFRKHAAELYAKALKEGKIRGLKRKVVEKRIADMGLTAPAAGAPGAPKPTPAAKPVLTDELGRPVDAPKPKPAEEREEESVDDILAGGKPPAHSPAAKEPARKPAPKPAAPVWCIVDVSGGQEAKTFPVQFTSEPPPGGTWGPEYKTDKIVLRRIPEIARRGDSFFYMGVFEVTQKQFRLVCGGSPASFKGDARPVESISYKNVRGRPISEPTDNSFLGILSEKTGLKFDLPTGKEWETACRAGTSSRYNNGGDTIADLKKLGRFKGNQPLVPLPGPLAGKLAYANHTVVGSYLPNAWGLYDMHGNVSEMCKVQAGGAPEVRGGAWNSGPDGCFSDRKYRTLATPEKISDSVGFRVSLYSTR